MYKPEREHIMNKSTFYAVLAAFSFHSTQVFSQTITASEFNTLYSCDNPFRPTETSIIILDEDIIIQDTVGGCEPIIAGPGFNPATDVVFFTSLDNHSVIIQASGLWIVGLNLTFNGNAQFQIQTGAILALQNNPTFRMSGNSIFKSVE